MPQQVRPSDAAAQWHASRSVRFNTKDVDLLILIGYNLSSRTGFEAKPNGSNAASIVQVKACTARVQVCTRRAPDARKAVPDIRSSS
jgi:hypothetical protein